LTFYKCTSLQCISIPTTVTAIEIGAFAKCHVLQIIDIPRQAEVNPDAFEHCPLLNRALEECGTDCIQGRFDALPIHQTCYNFNNDTTNANDAIINYFHSLQDNDQDLLQVDIMGMTPLHILCANPAATKDMIKQLYSKNIEAAVARNINNMLPWHMCVVSTDIHEYEIDEYVNADEYDAPLRFITDTGRMMLSNEFGADSLTETGLDIDVMEMYLILTGLSLGDWLETANAVTGLLPFMSMAKSNDCNLEAVYEVAIMNLNSMQGGDHVL
jgi:hypothetical protein